MREDGTNQKTNRKIHENKTDQTCETVQINGSLNFMVGLQHRLDAVKVSIEISINGTRTQAKKPVATRETKPTEKTEMVKVQSEPILIGLDGKIVIVVGEDYAANSIVGNRMTATAVTTVSKRDVGRNIVVTVVTKLQVGVVVETIQPTIDSAYFLASDRN